MAFAWDIFAEEIGKVGERAGARVAQRGIEKRAEERLEDRVTNLVKLRKQLDFDALKDEMEFKAGFDSLQYSVSKDLQGMAPEDAERTQASVIRARQGYPVDPNEFVGLSDLNQAKIADVMRTYGLRKAELKVKEDRVQIEADQLAAYVARTEAMKEKADVAAKEKAKKKPVDVKREIDIERTLNTEVEKDEEAFSKYFGKLMNELMGVPEGAKKILDSQGRFKIKQLGKDLKASLYNTETGEINQWVLTELLKKHPTFAIKFQRLSTLQGNVMRSEAMRDEIIPQEPTGISPELQQQLDRLGITIEQAIELQKKTKK